MDNYLSVPLCGVGLSNSILLQHQQRGNTMAVWTSTVTEEMTKGMTGNEIELLIADLNDAVQGVCEDFGIKA